MQPVPVFFYTLRLLPFGLALARFLPCTECYKRAFFGTSAQPHFVFNRSDIISDHILIRFGRLLVGDTGNPRVRETMQATFVMESGENGSAGSIWDIEEALIEGGVQNVVQEQLVRETAHCVSKVLSPTPGLSANQSAGPLYNKIRSELDKGLDFSTTEKISFCRPGRKDC
jgi:hypothetical protein